MYSFSNNGSETENNHIKTSTLAREHVNTQGTLARENISTQGTLAHKHARHVNTLARRARWHVSTFLARRARDLADSGIIRTEGLFTEHQIN